MNENKNRIFIYEKKDDANTSFLNFIKCFSNMNKNVYEELLAKKDIILGFLKYTNNIIITYINEKEKDKKLKILTNKTITKNILYIVKSFINNRNNKFKEFKNVSQKIMMIFLISFNYNILKYILKFKSNNNFSKKNKIFLTNLLNNILNIFGKLYLDKQFDDENFLLIIKYLIILSIANSIKKEPNKNGEIINLIFLDSCINLIKLVFKKLYELQNEYTLKQEETLNNIIIFLNKSIIDYYKNPNRIFYLNKVFLSQNDYKTLLLIDLYYIISKMKSKEITDNFIYLLSNIYIFSFKYENLMSPMARQIEPLFFNINKKNINKINEELNLSDFSLSLLDSLIDKEDQILKKYTCFLKEGFYLGNDTGGLFCDINSIGNEFIIIFGFRIESNELNEITLFHMVNNKDESTLLRLYLRKTYNNDIYELFVVDNKNIEYSVRININFDKNYIFTIDFKIGGLMHSTVVKFNYVKDDPRPNKKDFEVDSKSGKTLKIQNFKTENFCIYFGSEINNVGEAKRISRFHGFFGHIFILNSKNIKNYESNNDNNDFIQLLLSLEKNYSDILSIFRDNINNNISSIKEKSRNPKFIKIQKNIITLSENESKLFNTIIISDLFKTNKYEDDIDYPNFNKNENDFDEERNEISVKKKYLDLNLKRDPSENEKLIKIYTAVFDKKCHIFQNELTINAFIKFGGVYYLSLLIEYYYQILSQIYTIKKDYKEKDIIEICRKINQKIDQNLVFFYNNIIKTEKLKSDFNKYFYQISITLLKFLELSILNKETIQYLSNILIGLDLIEDNNEKIESIKLNLIIFLLNPKLYIDNDEHQIFKLNYMMHNLLNVIKNNPINKNNFLEKLDDNDILNKLLSFSWIINYNKYEIKNIRNSDNIINDDKKIKNEILLEATRQNYSNVLKEFLRSLCLKTPKEDKYISDSQKMLNQIIDKNKLDIIKNRSTIMVLEENKEDKKKSLIKIFFDKTLKYKKENCWYIFSNMLDIILETNCIDQLDEERIEKIQSIILNELENEDKNNYKSLIFISCLKMLITFYFNEDKNKIINKNNELKFRTFIRNIKINLEFFHALIFSLRHISFLSFNSTSIEETNKIYDKEIYSYSSIYLPFLKMDLKNLKKMQINAIKSILEEIVFTLYNESKKSDKEIKELKNIELVNVNKISDHNFEKQIYDILKKNIDIIFKYSDTKIYREIFSSNTTICAELFYLIWRYDVNEKGINYTENVIKRYIKNLLKNHSNPFIFKFYLYILNENLLDKNEVIDNKFKLFLLDSMINILNECQNEIETKDEKHKFYICNLLNYLILLNEELENNSLILQNIKFPDILYKYISLLVSSSLFFTNYYIELKEKKGKIISEIIYDLFFSISDFHFNESEFLKIFIKHNRKKQKKFTIFYLIDILKGKIVEKSNDNVKGKLKNFIPNIDDLIYIHKNYFNEKNSKIKLFLDTKLHRIENVNFTIYFLAKTFIYLQKEGFNQKFKELLKTNFLPLLSENIIRLYKKMPNFYGKRLCQAFPLYSKTKKFIEMYIINESRNFDGYFEFFESDIYVDLKEENNISFCYSSRLIHDLRKSNERRKVESNSNNRVTINSYEEIMNISSSFFDFEIIQDINTRKTTVDSSPFLKKNKNESRESFIHNSSKLLNSYNNKFAMIPKIIEKEEDEEEEEDEKKEKDEEEKEEQKKEEKREKEKKEKEEKNYLNYFEIINKKNIINNPKNYFFKKIFAEIYKNFIFEDKTFKLIRSTYLSKFRRFKNLNKSTKQINYPITLKNYSNSNEPKIFMRRDYDFYNERFFNISHSYIKKEIINTKLNSIYFYPHKIKISEQKGEYINLNCELVTQQYSYFGIMHFFEDFIFYETEKDPRNDDESLDIFMKYAISNRNKENIFSKQKSILLFIEDIKEVIQRRTLLTNQSIEIFSKNGKSYFFNFFRTNIIKKVYNYFHTIQSKLLKNNLSQFIFNINNNEEEIKNLIFLFRKGKITNYEYLLYLNKYATRTYNDLSQYPVFPWIVKDHDKITEVITLLSNKDIKENSIDNLRDFKYAISLQSSQKRNDAKVNYLDDSNNSKFPSHLGTHYSTPAFIYYYLMRINPFGKNLIKLQNYKLEDPNRMFNSFREVENIFKTSNDNREAIPDFYCYFDYFCNLNCCLYSIKKNFKFVDDFKLYINDSYDSCNIISSYVNYLFNNKKLLNSQYISKIISKWVDIIFGKMQLPENQEERLNSFNIYYKLSYEQKVDFEKKIQKNYNLYKNKKISEKLFKEKIQEKIDYIVNFGMMPKQIIQETITYEGKSKLFEFLYKSKKAIDEKYIYFNKLSNDNYIVLKKDKKSKSKGKFSLIYDKNFKEIENIYECKSMNLIKYKINDNDIQNEKKQLYKINYAFSYFLLKNNKSFIPIFLSCRYYGNYFRVQFNNKTLNFFYEDFVTCIKARELTEKGDDIFYTGLLNGKLTEWQVFYIEVINPNKKNKTNVNLRIKQIKYVYAHKSSITAIEIYHKQNIIITSGEDKYIYIRKVYDFELLTVINLIYSFGNPIISNTLNIFPSLIKVSELNLLYVLLYDYDSNKNFIRGYNLNGLFFAQTDPLYFKDNKIYLDFNNISFTKYSNLIVGFYNSNKLYVLDASNLIPLWIKNIKKEEEIIQKIGTNMVEYNYKNDEFYITYDNEIIIMSLKDKNEEKEFDSL